MSLNKTPEHSSKTDVSSKVFPIGNALAQLIVEKQYQGIVTAQKSTSEFYAFINVNGSDIIMNDYSPRLNNTPEVSGYSPAVGDMACAFSTVVTAWCRAYVFAVKGKSYGVCLVDYGWCESVCIRQFNPLFASC